MPPDNAKSVSAPKFTQGIPMITWVARSPAGHDK